MKPLPLDYYRHHDVLFLCRDLLGKYLMTYIDRKLTGGMIIECEAYRGPEDRASHAFGGRRTRRNEVMYSKGGLCYVYRCYGIHNLFNIVTHSKDIPHAILIRALKPVEGIETMLIRRRKEKVDKTLCGGPGTLTQALGIKLEHNGLPLSGPEIWVEDRGVKVPKNRIITGPRIGVAYAAEHARLPWRFRMARES
jgi:DNA-3-methyladenine glycosylase